MVNHPNRGSRKRATVIDLTRDGGDGGLVTFIEQLFEVDRTPQEKPGVTWCWDGGLTSYESDTWAIHYRARTIAIIVKHSPTRISAEDGRKLVTLIEECESRGITILSPGVAYLAAEPPGDAGGIVS